MRKLVKIAVAAVLIFAAAGHFGIKLPDIGLSTNQVTTASQSNDYGSGYTVTTWDEQSYPDFVRVVSGANLSGKVDVGQVSYSQLDSLGRAQRVSSCITYEMYVSGSERERADDFSSLHPTGWPEKNTKIEITFLDGSSYYGEAFNRSHLLAKSLGGHDELDNLVTGTRTQNVGKNDGRGGMAYTETIARDWIEENREGYIDYIVTPVYTGDELVARSVYVDMRTSDGAYDLHVEVFNVVPGYDVLYASGGLKAL